MIFKKFAFIHRVMSVMQDLILVTIFSTDVDGFPVKYSWVSSAHISGKPYQAFQKFALSLISYTLQIRWGPEPTLAEHHNAFFWMRYCTANHNTPSPPRYLRMKPGQCCLVLRNHFLALSQVWHDQQCCKLHINPVAATPHRIQCASIKSLCTFSKAVLLNDICDRLIG